MIEILGEIVWQEAPTVSRNSLTEREGNAWYVSGVERVEIEGTGGWRHGERNLYLQEDGSWAPKSPLYFPTEKAAQEKMLKTLGKENIKTPDANEISAFELALQDARSKKRKKSGK